VTAAEAAKKWQVAKSSVLRWLQTGRIPGSSKTEQVIGKQTYSAWWIPEDAPCPIPIPETGPENLESFLIRHHWDRSYAQIRRATGADLCEIQKTYDRLFEEGKLFGPECVSGEGSTND